MKEKVVFAFTFLIVLSNILFSQMLAIVNLADVYRKGEIKAVNRILKVANQDGVEFIRLSENEGEGIVWLPLKKLRNGTIEIRMRGKDVLQKSFIGAVFHSVNDSTYDAVYCRPFNFFAKDSVRRIHAIQYISHPAFTWRKLREEQNAVFEKEVTNPPDPNGWFTLRLVIEGAMVKAFINDAGLPSLAVEKLNKRSSGKIGLFVGDGSGGDFKTVKIKYKK